MRQLAPRTPLLIGISLILIVASLCLLLSNKNDRSQPNSKLALSAEILAGEMARTDQPGEAQDYYRLKRAPVGEFAVPVERYLVARERMRVMRRHSTGLGRMLSTDDLRSQDVMQLSLDAWNWLGRAMSADVHARCSSILPIQILCMRLAWQAECGKRPMVARCGHH